MIDFKQILLPINRGKLWDIVVFLFNILAMFILSSFLLNLFRSASDGDKVAQFALGLMCLGVFILPPLGTYLKRWHYQERLSAKEKAEGKKPKSLFGN